MSKRTDYKTLNVDPKLHQEMRMASAESRIPIGVMVEQAWALYIRAKSTADADLPPAIPSIPIPYLAGNKRWHDILEQVLNDPDEALGIMKNLEWAERTVTAKPPKQKKGNGS